MKVETLGKAGYRKFGFIMAIFIALIFGLFFPFVFSSNIPNWPWVVSGVFILWALLVPMTLAVVYKPWMLVGHFIGAINTKIILTIVFFLVFTPVALLFKVLGKDPMNRKLGDKSLSSYWKESKKQSKDHMEKVY